MTSTEREWGPWLRHTGGCMPVPAGTLVEVNTLAKFRTPRDGPRRKIGIAGVDFVKSWGWTPANRTTFGSLPIDFYRVARPRGLTMLERLLTSLPAMEDA